MAPNSSDVFVLFVSFRQISFCVFLKKIFATRLRKQTKRVMDPSLLKTKNLHEVKHWIEPGTYVRPYHIPGNLLHWIALDFKQYLSKLYQVTDWLFLHTDFVFRTGQLWLGPMELRRRGQATISLPSISNQNFLTEPLLSFSITFNFSSSEKVYV